MDDFIPTFMIFIGVVAFTLIVLGGFFTASIKVGLSRKLGLMIGGGAQRLCRNDQCRQINPAYAKFCGRCGRPLVDEPGRRSVEAKVV